MADTTQDLAQEARDQAEPTQGEPVARVTDDDLLYLDRAIEALEQYERTPAAPVPPTVADPAALAHLDDCDDYDDYDGEERFCFTCYNYRWIVVCPDDLCRGGNGCMHGDGEIPCPDCNPDGLDEPLW